MSLVTTEITMDSVRPPSANRGLSQREAEGHLRQVGPNDPSPRKRGALLIELLVLFLNPLILLIAVLFSIVVGQVTDAAIIFVIAMLSVVINYIRTHRSERSVRRLRHVSLTASVLRDGNWQELRRVVVVPGDLVRLSGCDLVPADGFLVESLATQTLVLFVIRTAGNPLASRPNVRLTVNTLAVVAVGLALPWSPLAGLLGFTALPLGFFLFLGISTITYLLLVEAARRKFFAVSHHQATSLAEAAT
jgi:magnesium-transporting ATPase (P-type)